MIGKTNKFVFILILLFAFNGCRVAGSNRQAQPGQLKVVVTTGILADAVRHIGGENLYIVTLMGPGVDPHLYKASEGDVMELDKADIIVYQGLHLEGKMADILHKIGRVKKVIAAGELVSEERLLSPPEFKGQHDPHIWFDLSIWAELVDSLSVRFAKLDTVHTEEYLANGARYSAELRALHSAIRDSIAIIPPNQRVLITAHDAFSYFGIAYGVEVRALQGLSTMSEYGLMDVTDLVDFIVKRKIKAIFVETSLPVRSIRAVQAGVRGKGHQVEIGGELYSDALGAVDTPEGTFIGMVKHNTTTIVKALK